MNKNELLQELANLPVLDYPVRIVQVDDTSKLVKRIEGIELVDGELVIIVDNYAAVTP